MSEVVQVYVPLPQELERRKNIGEKYLRKRLMLAGWKVWHTACFSSSRADYPFIRSSYEELCLLLERYRPGVVHQIEFLTRAYHGMPDFICYRQGVFKFVSCKFEDQTFQRSHKHSMLRLMELGFIVEVHTLVEPTTKALQAYMDVQTGERRVTEAQLTISAAQRRAEKQKHI